MGNFGWLVLYTIGVLLISRPVGDALRRWLRETAVSTRARSPREIGWGAALVPVTVAWLVALGAFTQKTIDYHGNLFGAFTLHGSYFWCLLTALATAGYAVARPRKAGYLAAGGMAALGAWVLIVAVTFPHYFHEHQWFGWLRDQTTFPVLASMGLACLAIGGELSRRTIFPDIRSRRSGLTARVRQLAETRAVAVDSAAAELRRLERDLHDGAQARLVALGINLRAAQKLIATSPDEAADDNRRVLAVLAYLNA